MSNEDLLSIGAFAMWTGLSINALRHYDEIGLLKPASTDQATGYRRYQRAQIRQAKLICALRAIDLPIDAVRQVLDGPDGQLSTVLRLHRKQLLDQAHALTQMARTADRYIEDGVTMPELKTPRICQVTINITDLAAAITFYQAAFGATFNEDITSFQFGTWPSDDFFLLTVALPPNQHGELRGPTGTSRFCLLVSNVDEAHRRALGAGATEHHPPMDLPWKPRTSCVIDPSGNWIDLTQA